tara:strand:+ start:11444 stop:12004 length:561 start_codon:yes stop_codon:yes gene_type:complete
MYSLIVFGVLSLIEFYKIIIKVFKNKTVIYLSNFIFTAYVFLFCYFFLLFSNFLNFKFIVITLLLGCIASDIGGYLFGNIFKGPKLTKISPKKTISGLVGSFILSGIVVSSLFFYFNGNLNLRIIIIAFITSASCQLGDLFFSFLKRKSNLKDTGNILPGHGGILDRLDGILFGIPVGFLTLILLL